VAKYPYLEFHDLPNDLIEYEDLRGKKSSPTARDDGKDDRFENLKESAERVCLEFCVHPFTTSNYIKYDLL
jgi:hypothetical protein